MAKVLVLYYSAYGHIETMANAVAEGAREAGAKVDIKRVPEIVPEEMARAAHFKLNQEAPLAKIDDLGATTPSSLERVPALGASHLKWPVSWTRLAAFGCAGPCTERWVAPSPPRARNMAARRPRSSTSSRISFTSVW
jgi:hypothetical protein